MKYCRAATSGIAPFLSALIALLGNARLAKSELDHPADRSKEERVCMAAYRSAQDSEQSGQLREARASWATCAKAVCGDFLQKECASHFTQLGSDIPSVVPFVTDAAGEPRADVQLRVDGELFASQLDGRALQINPGLHEFAFSTQAGVFATQKLMILQGQRNRLVSASLPAANKRAHKRIAMASDKPSHDGAPDPAASEQTGHDADDPWAAGETSAEGDRADGDSGRSLTLPLALAGAGLAAGGVGSLLVYWGRADNLQLSNCTPNCPKGSVDHIRRLYLAGDIAIGVGAAAVVAAYWTFALSRSNSEERPRRQAFLFDLQPARSGAVASLSGSF
jgi:hypothetical protein